MRRLDATSASEGVRGRIGERLPSGAAVAPCKVIWKVTGQ